MSNVSLRVLPSPAYQSAKAYWHKVFANAKKHNLVNARSICIQSLISDYQLNEPAAKKLTDSALREHIQGTLNNNDRASASGGCYA